MKSGATRRWLASAAARWAGIVLVGATGCGADHVIGSLGLGAVRHYSGTAIEAIAIGDFDGDGAVDLVSQDRSGLVVCLLRGAGDGTLLPLRCQALTEPAQAISALPTTQGKALLVRAGAAISLWSVSSEGVFAKNGQSSLLAPAAPQGLTVVELDGDDRADLLVAESAPPQVEVLRGLAPGFRPSGSYSVTVAPLALLYRDLDGDHHPELAALLPGSLTLWSERGLVSWSGCSAPQWTRPLGLWPVQRWQGAQPALMVLDGSLGLLSAMRALSGTRFAFTCGEFVALPGGPTPAASALAMTSADLDADGDAELLLAGSDGVLRVYRARDEAIALLTEQRVEGGVAQLWAADLDHDELPEVIAVSAQRDDLLVLPNLFRR